MSEFNMAAWLKKRLADPSLSTTEYLHHERALQDIEFRQRVLDAEYAHKERMLALEAEQADFQRRIGAAHAKLDALGAPRFS
jgi:hypothetical protein